MQAEDISAINQKLETHQENKIRYEQLGQQLGQSGDTQISTTDPDARALLVQEQVVDVSYNMQEAVDDRHNLVIANHVIERSEYAGAVESNLRLLGQNRELYKRRQMMNEHIFGPIKRKWGYNYTVLRGLEKVNGEIALIMTGYNFRRAINILGIEDLMEKLRRWKPDYKTVSFWPKSGQIESIRGLLAQYLQKLEKRVFGIFLNEVQGFKDINPLYTSEKEFL